MTEYPKNSIYEGKVRLRACGILLVDDKILLVKHKGLTSSNDFWSPPGGGVQFGESAHQAVIREFREETGLEVAVTKYLFTNEYINDKLHAMEIFFEIRLISGKLTKGIDPELSTDNQIILGVDWLNVEAIRRLPNESLHNALQKIKSLKDLLEMSGFFQFAHNSSK